MPLLTAVGSFAQPTATGNQRITGLGFQPKLVFFWMSRPTADGAAANAIQGFGAATSSSNRAYSSGFDTDAVSTTAAAGCVSAGACIGVASSTANVSATAATAEADFVSMDNSGFTINWTTVDAVARIVNYLALGGSDVANVTVGTGQAGTTTGTKAYTGLGFQPTVVLLWIYASTGSTPPTSAASIQSHGPGFGIASSFGQGTVYGTAALSATAKLATASGNMAICSASAGLVAYPLVLSRINAAFQAASGQGTSNTHKYERTTQVLGAITSTSAAINREADLTSLDSGGFTLNWTTVSATAAFFVYAALRGPSFAVGSLTQPTSPGTQQITGLGFQPSALMLTSDNATASTAIVAGARNSFGAVAPPPAPAYATASLQANAALATASGNMAICSATAALLAVPIVYNRFTQWVGDTNAATPSIAKSYLDRTAVIDMITEGAGSQTINASADLLSFDVSGFSLNWTSADATAREVLYLAIGPGIAASLIATASLTAAAVQSITGTATLAATAALTTTVAVAASASFAATTSLTATDAVAASASLVATVALTATDTVASSPTLSATASLITSVAVAAVASCSATATGTPGIGRAAQLSASTSLSVLGSITVAIAFSAVASMGAAPFLIMVTLSANATMLAYGPTNFYFPASDGPVGSWTTDQDSPTGLFSRVDELVPRDTDFDRSSVNPVLDAMTLNFPPITPAVGQNVRLHVRYSKDQLGDTDDLQIDLIQTGFVVQTWTLYDVPTGWQQFDTFVTTPISDWSALQLRFTARILVVTTGAVASLIATPNIVASLQVSAALATQQRIVATEALAAQATMSFVVDLITPGSTFAAAASMTLPASAVRANGSLSAVASITTAVSPYVIIEPLVIF